MTATELTIEPGGVEMAVEIHRITQLAFAEHLVLDPPSGAPSETLEGYRSGNSQAN